MNNQVTFLIGLLISFAVFIPIIYLMAQAQERAKKKAEKENLFRISAKQWTHIEKWVKSLHRSKKTYYGREVQYIFTPGAIGYGLEVKDIKTGKTKDFTDHDEW